MKTKGLNKLAVLGLILLSFTSCKEEEFYEKEFIDTLAEQYERENLPDDIAEAFWEENQEDLDSDGNIINQDIDLVEDDNSSSQSDSDENQGSVVDNGGNDGSDAGTPGSDDSNPDYNPGEDQNPDDQNNEGPIADNDNNDGSDAGTPGSDDSNPDYNPGEGQDSDDQNNEGPIADNGGNDDSDASTPGSDDSNPDYNPGEGQDSDDNTPPAIRLSEVENSFQVQSAGQKLDIVWVIDNSGSMDDEQRALGENFEAFIKEFVKKDVDFKMAVTTTDTRRNNAGRAYKNSMSLLTSEKLKQDKSRFMKNFANLVKVGTNGSGYEKGIKASEKFAHRYSNNWIRPDAYLTIVYLSDEEDQSEKSVSAHLKQIQKKKSNKNLVKAYSIVDMVPSRRQGAVYRGYKRYKEISERTGGEVASIKSDFYDTLLKMGEQISNLAQQYSLSQVPYSVESIKVIVNGEVNSSWKYEASSNAIVFNADSIPASGSTISVTYDVEDKN